ncbi:MAG: hypothetical protein OHK0031_00150 [Anaerolineales bacterium]
MTSSLWYKNAVFYQISVRAYQDGNGDGIGDLPGLLTRLDYLQALGVDCLWLMPLYPSPLRDDGYDVADYCNIAPAYGALDDFQTLLDEAHRRGIRIIMDLVLNHSSDQHPWFQAARSDRCSPYRDYYVWSDSGREYSQARIIFSDLESSNWAWDEQAGQYYWHRFYAHQPDLNYDNPAVQDEMLNVARFWLKMGVDGFRVDAPTYLFEREGTNCESLPETHAYLKRLRRVAETEFSGRILLAETNQWPRDLREYFGDGDEFHMAFHFPLMPRIFLALARQQAAPIGEILQETPPIPETCQWATFLRNHDELTLEMVTDEERHFLWQHYAPDPRMRLNLGIRRRLAPLLENDRRKIELANALLFSLPGALILYYGDEIGMGDNLNLPDRNGVRTPMQWDDSPHGGFSSAAPFAEIPGGPYAPKNVNAALQMRDPASLWHSLRRMIAIRKQIPAFGGGGFAWLAVGNLAVAAYLRPHASGDLLALHNLTDAPQEVELPAAWRGPARDLLSGEALSLPEKISLPPYAYLWLTAL